MKYFIFLIVILCVLYLQQAATQDERLNGENNHNQGNEEMTLVTGGTSRFTDQMVLLTPALMSLRLIH
nr:unnamed protein product [Fasciola hepatica]